MLLAIALMLLSPPLQASPGAATAWERRFHEDLHYETWKERYHPDMPALAPCILPGFTRVETMAELPQEVRTELSRFFGPEGGIAEAGGPFDGTDVFVEGVPRRRFLRAYGTRDRWIVWYQDGGLGPRTIELARRSPAPTGKPGLSAQGGTVLSGDLCAASRAVIAGVRGTGP